MGTLHALRPWLMSCVAMIALCTSIATAQTTRPARAPQPDRAKYDLTPSLHPWNGPTTNPTMHGYADPALREHEGRLYMLVGNDLNPRGDRFFMPYWTIFSTDDLVNWRAEARIDPDAIKVMGKGSLDCWAGDIGFRNGKVYVYYSDGGRASGVLVADSLAGPFRDEIGGYILKPAPAHKTPYDPVLFIDDDNTPYWIAGRHGRINDEPELRYYHLAKLNEDMMSFAEDQKSLITEGQYGMGTAKTAQDHAYFHKHNGTYYLSRDKGYQTAKNIYGPYSNMRDTGPNAQRGHACYFPYRGQTYHSYEFTDDCFGVRTYRQVMFTYLHYRENGDMIDDAFFLKGNPGYSHGVGNYDATWDAIQAEWYFEIQNATKRDGPDTKNVESFVVETKADARSWLRFPKIQNVPASGMIELFVRNASDKPATITLRTNDANGQVLGEATIPPGGEADQTVRIPYRYVGGAADLCFVFDGASVRVDRFGFARKR